MYCEVFSISFNKRNLNLIQWIWKFLKDYGMINLYRMDKTNVLVDYLGRNTVSMGSLPLLLGGETVLIGEDLCSIFL